MILSSSILCFLYTASEVLKYPTQRQSAQNPTQCRADLPFAKYFLGQQCHFDGTI